MYQLLTEKEVYRVSARIVEVYQLLTEREVYRVFAGIVEVYQLFTQREVYRVFAEIVEVCQLLKRKIEQALRFGMSRCPCWTPRACDTSRLQVHRFDIR